VKDVCRVVTPPLLELRPAHTVACHVAAENAGRGEESETVGVAA
jgi:peptide/nickel transport system ATP-binding protein